MGRSPRTSSTVHRETTAGEVQKAARLALVDEFSTRQSHDLGSEVAREASNSPAGNVAGSL